MFSEMLYTPTGGWPYLYERKDLLAYHAASEQLRSGDEAVELPETVMPEWLRIEMQGSQGSCQGHALSSCVEYLNVLEGNNYTQLSRACAYYQSQRIDGIRGDRGSTVEAGIRLAMGDGLCSEEDWPYPSQYDNRIPSLYKDSMKWRIKGHIPVTTHQEVITHIGIRGPIHIGILWGEDIDRQVAQTGVISRYRPQNNWGGHSVYLPGYSSRDWEDKSATNQLTLLDNSWSLKWGRKGRCFVTKEALQAMIYYKYSVFEGLYGALAPQQITPEYGDLN